MAETMEKKFAYRRIHPSILFRRLISEPVRFRHFSPGGSLGVRESSIAPVQQRVQLELDSV